METIVKQTEDLIIEILKEVGLHQKIQNICSAWFVVPVIWMNLLFIVIPLILTALKDFVTHMCLCLSVECSL